LNWYDHHARQYDAEIGRWSAIDPALQGASPYMAMGNNSMMYVDADGRTWDIFKPFVKAWDYAWDKGNQFAQWANQVGIPSVHLGYGISSSGQIQPVGDINGYPLFDNESQYAASAQNAVNAINDARGDYFSEQDNNASYDQTVMSNIMPVVSNGSGKYNGIIYGTSTGFTLLDCFSTFICDHNNYTTTQGVFKSLNSLKKPSQQAMKYISKSNSLRNIASKGSYFTLASSGYNLIQGEGSNWDIADVTVAGVGLLSFYGASANIGWAAAANPYVAIGATIYFGGRGFYDLTQYSTSFLIRSGINPGN